MVAPDGSLAVNVQRDLCGVATAASSNHEPLRLLQESIDEESDMSPPIWIGSCGCQADCEELKRVVQRDLRAASFFGDVIGCYNGHNSVSPDQAAVLLSQILYSRRFFPYYSFCVLAGLHHDCGHVYGYDAVGSYEELAVTCAGQGRDLLQPILDQQFTSISRVAVSTAGSMQQRVVGHIPSTVVDCATPEEAVRILLNAYRSVSEREIGVGDHLIFYTVQKRAKSADGTRLTSYVYHSKIWTSALKKH
jgi:20S proteasome subunit beta 6